MTLASLLALCLLPTACGKTADKKDEAPPVPAAKAAPANKEAEAKAVTKDLKEPPPAIATAVPEENSGEAETVVLDAEKSQYFSFDEGVPVVSWTTLSGAVITLRVEPTEDEESAVIKAVVNGQERKLVTVTYDTARGGSGIAYKLVSEHELEIVASYGGAGADSGDQSAYLYRFEAASGALALVKEWSGEGFDDLPAWSSLPEKKGK